MLLHFILPFQCRLYVENFQSCVPLYFYICWCHGLRLSDLNTETTYLLTYLLSDVVVYRKRWGGTRTETTSISVITSGATQNTTAGHDNPTSQASDDHDSRVRQPSTAHHDRYDYPLYTDDRYTRPYNHNIGQPAAEHVYMELVDDEGKVTNPPAVPPPREDNNNSFPCW